MIILGLDLETNGLSSDDHEIEVVEFGGVLLHVETKTVIASYGKVYRVETWSDGAEKIHKIPQALSNLGGHASDDISPFTALSGDMADMIVAHNAPHDHPLVIKLWPEFLSKPWICTQRDLDHNKVLPRKAYSKRLAHLCVDYEIKMDNWHRAQADAEACARIASFHDLEAALAYKRLPKFRFTTWGSQRVGKTNVNEKLREAPSVEIDGRRYRWNTDKYPKVWVKEDLLKEHVILDAKYLKEITGGKWSFDVEDMDPKPY